MSKLTVQSIGAMARRHACADSWRVLGSRNAGGSRPDHPAWCASRSLSEQASRHQSPTRGMADRASSGGVPPLPPFDQRSRQAPTGDMPPSGRRHVVCRRRTRRRRHWRRRQHRRIFWPMLNSSALLPPCGTHSPRSPRSPSSASLSGRRLAERLEEAAPLLERSNTLQVTLGAPMQV